MKKITERIKEERLFFDGGTGTVLQRVGLLPGEPTEVMNTKARDEVVKLHLAYLEAGADIIKTNTFGINKLKCDDVERELSLALDIAKEAIAAGYYDDPSIAFLYAWAFWARFPSADPNLPGSGAAGGLGFALRSYLNATLRSGVELVLETTRLGDHMADADLVITGEGRLDSQSAMGKAPVGVARLAKQFCKPVVAFCGCVGKGAPLCNHHGIDAYFPILQAPCTLAEAMDEKNAYENLKATAEQAVRLFALRP